MQNFQQWVNAKTGNVLLSFEISAEFWAAIKAEVNAMPYPVDLLEYVEVQLAHTMSELAPNTPGAKEMGDGSPSDDATTKR